MTTDTLRQRPFAAFVSAAALVATALAASALAAQAVSDPQKRLSEDLERNGAQVEGPMATLTLRSLDGQEVRLADLWRDRPALLVTSSLTCPVARERYAFVDEIVERFGDRLNVAILYTLEAHPEGDPSPYAGYRGENDPSLEWIEKGSQVWQTQKNKDAGILRRQPADFAGREVLAREFRERVSVRVPVLIDDMDNRAWLAVGGGPNMGILVRPDGTVEAKHGWFDGPSMQGSIEWLLERLSKGSS